MNTSKFVQLFSTLSLKEKKDFVYYISSPANNNNELLIKLVKFIYDNEKKIEHGKLNKEDIYNYLHPSEKYNVSKFSLYLAYINKHLNSFIVFIEINNDEYLSNQILLEALKKRRVESFVEFRIKEMKKNLDAISLKNSRYYFNKFNIEKEHELYLFRNEIGSKNENNQNSIKYLDIYFISLRLKESCELYVLNSFKVEKFDTQITDFLLLYVEKNLEIFKKVSCVYIYYQIIQLFKIKDVNLFNNIREFIKQQEVDFPKDELRIIYSHLIAFCHLMENVSEEKEYYAEIMFSIYKYLIDNECLFQGESDSHISYHNIVYNCLRLKKYDYAREFISSFKNKLHHTEQEFHYKRALASLYRSEKNYTEAIKILRNLSSKNPFIDFDIRQSLLSLYFLNRQLDDFENYHEAFKMFLFRRKKMLPEYHYNLLHNYLIIIKKIFFFKLQFKMFDKVEYNELYTNIYEQTKNTHPLLHKKMLIKQLDSIAIERPISE